MTQLLSPPGPEIATALHNLYSPMHRRLLVALLSASSLAFGSCSQRIYFPDSAPSFGFRGKGHAKAFVSAKGQGNSYTGDTITALFQRSRGVALAADAGYAFAPRWAVYGAYRGVNRTHRSNTFYGEGHLYNGRRGEGGIVYFAPAGRHGALEAMAGAGAGRLQCESTDPQRDFSLRYIRYSMQGALSIQSTDEAIRGYFGLRAVVQHFHRFDSPDPDLPYTIGQDQANIFVVPTAYSDIRSRPLGMLEPYVGFEAGYRWLRFVGQTGFTVRYFGPRIGGGSLYASVGVGFQWPVLPERSAKER